MARGTRQGTALVLALWLSLLLGALAMAAMRLAGSGAGAAQAQADLARARAAAEGGLWAAAHRLAALPPEARPPVVEAALQLGAVAVRVQARDEDGRLDLNAAPPALLAGLFALAGLPADQAEALAAAAEERRRAARRDGSGTARRAFATAGELAALPGLGPAQVAALRPLVTVHTGLARPAAEAAPDPLAALLAAEAAQAALARALTPGYRTPAAGARGGRRQVWRIEAEGRLGAALGRVEAVIALGPAGGLPGRVLEWHPAPPAP